MIETIKFIDFEQERASNDVYVFFSEVKRKHV